MNEKRAGADAPFETPTPATSSLQNISRLRRRGPLEEYLYRRESVGDRGAPRPTPPKRHYPTYDEIEAAERRLQVVRDLHAAVELVSFHDARLADAIEPSVLAAECELIPTRVEVAS